MSIANTVADQRQLAILKKVGTLREVACRLLTEHERLAVESRTIAIQLLTLEQELSGLPATALPTPPPHVVPLRP